MRVTYDPEKREQTLRERGLDFEDAEVVFSGVSWRSKTRAGTTVKFASSAMACSRDEWWLWATRRVARIVTCSV
jgi:uncharacterized DUF497 family protein